MTIKQIADNFVNTSVNTIQTVFTAPTDKSVAIEAVSIVNNSNVNASFKVYIASSGGVVVPLMPFTILVWGRINVGVGIVNQAIPPSGSLQIESSALASIYVTATGREVTV